MLEATCRMPRIGRVPGNPGGGKVRRGNAMRAAGSHPGTAQDRAAADDVAAFERRAAGYDGGRLGEWHRRLAGKVAGLVRGLEPTPEAVLDVGCGTGQLLRALARSMPDGTRLVGADPAGAMIAVASAAPNPPDQVSFVRAAAEACRSPPTRSIPSSAPCRSTTGRTNRPASRSAPGCSTRRAWSRSAGCRPSASARCR
jgi:hypothetical protein